MQYRENGGLSGICKLERKRTEATLLTVTTSCAVGYDFLYIISFGCFSREAYYRGTNSLDYSLLHLHSLALYYILFFL